MKYFTMFFALSILLIIGSCSNKIIKIACVGDSITEGYGLSNQSKTAYPVVLDSILGLKYSVLNCGRSGATLQKKGDFSYWNCKELSNVYAFNPKIIIIKLGTNDAKKNNWNALNFEKDYQSLIDGFSSISAKPKIYICLPVPAFKTVWDINDSTIINEIIPSIKKIAKTNNITIIDLYHQMQNQSENFPDGIHPNEKADKIIAEIIAKEIK